MIFKKFSSYKIEQDNFSEVLDSLLEKMAEHKFQEDPIGNRTRNSGWVKTNQEYEELHASGSTSTYVSLLIATKKVPKDKINRKLEERMEEMRETDPGLEISSKEIKEMKTAIEEELIVDEEPKYKKVNAAINITEKRIDIDASTKDADELISFMRTTIGGSGIKATPYFSDIPMTTYKRWLLEGAPGAIEMGGDHVLKDMGAGTTVTYKKVDADDELMLKHLSNGFEVTKTSIVVDEKYSGTLNDKGEVSGFKIEDLGQEEIEGELGDMEDGYFEAMLDLMYDSRTEFLSQIRKSATE